MMEVTADEAVLLEGMDGTQYITIQRTDGEGLTKNLLINGELISEGMVVDIINAGVANEYTDGTQFYETDDLLPHELTEEDRKLAAALVAVQLQQQQKHLQNHQNQPQNDGISHVNTLTDLSPVNTYSIQSLPPDSEQPSSPTLSHSSSTAYSSLPLQSSLKRINHVRHEFINVKCEYDLEISNDTDDNALPAFGPRQYLPHKKRIAKKLKQQTNKKQQIDQIIIYNNNDDKKNQDIQVQLNNQSQSDNQRLLPTFKCELCNSKFGGQLKFFEHLKIHYEPIEQEKKTAQSTNTNVIVSLHRNIPNLENTVEEFSEPEDLMEGIRNVVEETGAHIDDDSESNPLDEVNHNSSWWDMVDDGSEVSSTICKQNQSTSKEKKKKSSKTKKNQYDDMTCPQCDRTFNHKNSLVYHMRSHSGERPHQCETCGKSFFAASALKVHKRLHSGDKPYKCEDCGRQFRQWGDLKYHSMSIHSDQRQFQCEYCGKDFARKYSLIVHRRIHTGEKNYRCEYCNKTFRASSYLQNHRRIHTGEKPHPCTICGKPFRVRSDMKRHMNTHSKGRNDPSVNSGLSPSNNEENRNEHKSKIENKNEIDNENKIEIEVEVENANEDEDEMKDNKRDQQTRTLIQDLVQELKLESPNNKIEIVSSEDNPETILPHEGNPGIDYNAPTVVESNTDRDPLEAINRTSDSLQYFFM